MTNITIYCKNDKYIGICLSGHSGYADEGEDIVCAGISALTINFINSIDMLTDEPYGETENEEEGIIDFRFDNLPGSDAELLIKSLVLGLEQLENDYKDFISLDYKEV